jgi:SAM-dependent methyltransferase
LWIRAHLVFCPPGSDGIEIEEFEVKFAQSIGLTVHQRDVLYDSLEDLPKVDAVWNSAVLEHVESPHIFLRKLHSLLKPDGLLAIYVPTIPPFQFLEHLPRLGHYFTGYLYGDHINAFTPQTLKFFCERAGFETLEVSSFYPQPFSFLRRHLMLIDGCMYVGKKKEDWDYPDNATRRKANTGKGFVFNGQVFSSDGKQ